MRGQVRPVAIELRRGLGDLGVDRSREALERGAGLGARRRLDHLVQQFLGVGLQTLGERVLGAEPLPLPGLITDALVVDPRRRDRHGARADLHPALEGAAVAHDQPLPVLVDLIDERRDVLVRFGPQRRAIMRRAPREPGRPA